MATFIRPTNSQIRRMEREVDEIEPTSLGDISDIKEIAHHVYSDDEIKNWRMDESIQNHPLSKKPTVTRSKLAYKEVLKNVKPSTKYILPGMFCIFGYKEPKYKDTLEYYDATPFGLFFGIVRTKDNTVRELAFNVHYYPPYARTKILNTVYEVFKTYYQKYFNDSPNKPNRFINYRILKTMLRKQHVAFGLRMYIPVLRGKTYILPTKLIPTACYTEGHFNKATLAQIQKYWRAAR